MSAADYSTGAADPEWEAFRALDRMANHWNRPGWRAGRQAYYWYVSFRDQHRVQALAQQCQAALAAPFLDLVDGPNLHMTLERVAFAEDIDEAGRKQVAHNAATALQGFPEIHLRVGPLAGSSGALSFSVSPRARLHELRAALLSATHSAGFAPDISASRPFRPHIGIGYCNHPVDAKPVIDRVRSLRDLPRVDVCISEVVLVALTRHERAYSWDITDRLPLATEN